MKFSPLVLAASGNASTLFSPIYEYVAQSLVNQASGMLTGLTALDSPIDIAGNAALVGAINDFNTALTTMDNQAIKPLLVSSRELISTVWLMLMAVSIQTLLLQFSVHLIQQLFKNSKINLSQRSHLKQCRQSTAQWMLS